VLDPGELVAGCYLTSEPVNVEPLNPAKDTRSLGHWESVESQIIYNIYSHLQIPPCPFETCGIK
jgi:hypothetical protein